MIKNLVIAWDLDGTLIDSTHRAINKNGEIDYNIWLKKCTKQYIFKDTLLPLTKIYFSFQKAGFTQICITSRTLNSNDLEFLNIHNLKFNALLHRENSEELSEILKSRLVKDFFEKNQLLPFIAFDDKKENLAVLKKFGFRTFNADYLNEKLRLKSFNEVKKLNKKFFGFNV